MNTLPHCEHLLLSHEEGILTIELNRPEKKNAMSAQTVFELSSVFDSIKDDRTVRGVVLRGSHGNFCAGGDISGMRDSRINSNAADLPDNSGMVRDESWHFNRSFGHLITAVNQAPQVTVCVLEGAVLGGGLGLACVCDVAITSNDAMFAMPETGLGIIPAQIAPFVVARIGLTQARRLALLGERINGQQALDLGLVHQVVFNAEGMAEALDNTLKMLRKCAPQATAITKALLIDASKPIRELESFLDRASDDFSKALKADEGKEGTQAFVDKRKPNWQL